MEEKIIILLKNPQEEVEIQELLLRKGYIWASGLDAVMPLHSSDECNVLLHCFLDSKKNVLEWSFRVMKISYQPMIF